MGKLLHMIDRHGRESLHRLAAELQAGEEDAARDAAKREAQANEHDDLVLENPAPHPEKSLKPHD